MLQADGLAASLPFVPEVLYLVGLAGMVEPLENARCFRFVTNTNMPCQSIDQLPVRRATPLW